tara:strand:+ start:56369 stop:56497 length:129 start_codon:yes stop_codon:yes gene_type:complete
MVNQSLQFLVLFAPEVKRKLSIAGHQKTISPTRALQMAQPKT